MQKNTVSYMEKSRLYYQAHGYEKPYQWAHFEDVPFTSLNKPLSECTATIVTTAMPNDNFAREFRSLQLGETKNNPESFFTQELSWDKDATHTDDVDSFFPIQRMKELVEAQRLGKLADHYYCAPTAYSQRQTNELDAPAILESCLAEEVDIVVLVPL